MEIKAQDMFHTPEGWNELHDWINRHNADERAHLTTAALMAWNLAAKIQAMPEPETKPDTINGFPVVRSAQFTGKGGMRSGRVVLVHTGKGPTPYVVAIQFETDGKRDSEWWQGDYYPDMESALARYETRYARRK